MDFTCLCAPITIGTTQIKNRFVVPPMANNFADTNGAFSDRSLAYYTARAKGGFGLIFLEATVVDPTSKAGHHKPCLFSDDTIESFRSVADACHAYGAKVAVQLQHAGPMGNAAVSGHPLKAASAVQPVEGKPLPEAMTECEIQTLIKYYGEAAKRAQAAGIDFVEVHCAHGYLIHSFLSPLTNQRTDRYGGSFENRLRIVSEILAEIKQNAPGMPILCRINGCDDLPGGLTLDDSIAIAKALENLGVSALDISRGTHRPDTTLWASAKTEPGFSEEVFSAIHNAVSVPVIAVGRFTDPRKAEAVLRRNSADLIAFGRQSLADPELPNKVQTGQLDDLVFCTACLAKCVPNLLSGEPLTCVKNQMLGREGETATRAENRRKS